MMMTLMWILMMKIMTRMMEMMMICDKSDSSSLPGDGGKMIVKEQRIYQQPLNQMEL